MMLCKRPFRIYDVDLLGCAALAVLGLAAYFGVVARAHQHWDAYRRLSAQLSIAERCLRETDARLRTVVDQIDQLKGGVAEEVRAAPKPDSLARFLSRLTALAAESHLQVVQVLPQPIGRENDCLVSDVRIAGRGRSLDFIRFLDQLGRENPYQSLQQFSMTCADDADDADGAMCALSWTIRLYMLPADPFARDGDAS